MKFIAAINADFEQSFLGLTSRLNTDLCGETVIRRTIKRLRQARNIASIHLLVDASQQAVAQAAVSNLSVAVDTHSAGKPPWARYVASGRKWSLDSWRGGLAGTTVYDEFVHPWLLEALARRENADAVIDVPAAAPLLDPGLLDNLIEYYQKKHEETRIGLVQSAPGLSAIIYQPEMLRGLAGIAQPPGRAMAYRPDEPQNDIIHQPCWLATDATIAHAWGRCMADTATAMDRLNRILSEVGTSDPAKTPDAMAISRWLLAQRHVAAGPLPVEVEVEITTRDPLPDSSLRPHGPALERHADMSFDLFRGIIDDLARCDDRLIIFGGFGDPLLHPQWPEFVDYARKQGILGIALRTPAVNLDAECIDKLIASDLDVLNVLLDAATPETYHTLHNFDGFDQVIANIERLCDVQQHRQSPRPLIVCEMVKVRETMDEIEDFYDRWMRKTGSAVIAGPSSYAGQWPNRAIVRMAPPTRSSCARLPQRVTVLADGRLTTCDQDFRGTHSVGSLHQDRLAEIWQGPNLARFRQDHLAGRFAELPLCRACDEWHRP